MSVKTNEVCRLMFLKNLHALVHLNRNEIKIESER